MSMWLCPANIDTLEFVDSEGKKYWGTNQRVHHWVRVGTKKQYLSQDVEATASHIAKLAGMTLVPAGTWPYVDKVVYECVYCLTEKVGATG